MITYLHWTQHRLLMFLIPLLWIPTFPRDRLVSLLRHLLLPFISISTATIPSNTGLNTIASTSGTTSAEPCTVAETPSTHPTVASPPTTVVDLLTYGPAPSASTLTSWDFHIPEETLTLHTTANHHLESESHLSARLSALDKQITEFYNRLLDFNDQRRALLKERDSLRQAHTASMFERTRLTTSTARRICTLANSVPDVSLS